MKLGFLSAAILLVGATAAAAQAPDRCLTSLDDATLGPPLRAWLSCPDAAAQRMSASRETAENVVRASMRYCEGRRRAYVQAALAAGCSGRTITSMTETMASEMREDAMLVVVVARMPAAGAQPTRR